MWFKLLIILMLMAEVAFGSQPLVQLPYTVSSVDVLGGGVFRINGTTHDPSLLGYGAADVLTGDYLVIQSQIFGDIDLYTIDTIWSQSGNTLICDVSYAESGTPRSGQPEAGEQLVCRRGYTFSTTFDGVEYLQNGARNLFLDINITSITNSIFVLSNYVNYVTNTAGDVYTKSNNVYKSGTTQYMDSISLSNICYKYSGEQVINNGGTIVPHANLMINNTNAGVIALGIPQIATNGIPNGTFMQMRGASSMQGIIITNGCGISLDCEQSFCFKENDIMHFVFSGDNWCEVRRIDK